MTKNRNDTFDKAINNDASYLEVSKTSGKVEKTSDVRKEEKIFPIYV